MDIELTVADYLTEATGIPFSPSVPLGSAKSRGLVILNSGGHDTGVMQSCVLSVTVSSDTRKGAQALCDAALSALMDIHNHRTNLFEPSINAVYRDDDVASRRSAYTVTALIPVATT